MELVAFVARRRMESAREVGRRRINGLPDEDAGTERDDLIGAAAEYAVAKLANRFWNALALDVRKDVLRADVGHDLHVKAVSESHHNLIVKPNDPLFGVYLLCEVALPAVSLLGGFPAALIGPEDWRDALPVPAYLISRQRLLSPREAVLEARRLNPGTTLRTSVSRSATSRPAS